MSSILYVNATGEISGAERSLLAMLAALDRTRWAPRLAAPDGALTWEAAAYDVPGVDIPLAPLRRPRTISDIWQTWQAIRVGRRALAAVVDAQQPALLHANTTTAMLYAAGVKNIPLVWHVRDLALPGRLSAGLYRRATRVAVISQAVRAHVLPVADDEGAKIVVLPPAIDTARFHPIAAPATSRAHFGLPTDRLLIGMVAQFVPWKRHPLLLDALERLPELPWHAVLVGADFGRDNDYVAALRARLAAPPLAGRVTWLPWQEEMASLYAALDLCVLTSREEPFGRAVIEAMACEVPVVAVNDGGPREIIDDGETGLLVPAEPAALAEALRRLLIDATLRACLGRAARQAVEARYGLAAHGAALTQLYQDCLP